MSSLRLASTRLIGSLGTSSATTGITPRLTAAYQLSARRNMSTANKTTTEILGRKFEKRTLYSVLAVLGTIEGYFWYSTYYNKKRASEQKASSESKPVNN